MRIFHLRWLVGLGLVCFLAAGCRGTYYSALEKVGVHKRDLLKKRVIAARNDQKEAGEQFQDALSRLKALYGFEGGNLENTYNALKRDYDRSAEKAEDVRRRIRDVETVAGDLFKEWEGELRQISSPELRASSREQLRRTRDRYEDLHQALSRAEAMMGPVLVKFRDQVLFLKHNLNAQAIASLRGESLSIQGEIAKLIEEMNRSIAEADEFLKTLI